MNERPNDTTITITRTFAASRERVFDAFTVGDQVRQWWGDENWVVTSMETDAQTGGGFRFEMLNRATGETFRSSATYNEVKRPERLVWTNFWEGQSGLAPQTRVTVQFREVKGGTEVTILHEFFPDKTTRDHHLAGWTASLDALPRLLGV
jgi:uncharacterized protein YndB with AHSA1/START domain